MTTPHPRLRAMAQIFTGQRVQTPFRLFLLALLCLPASAHPPFLGKPRQLWKEPVQARHLACSPDGRWVAFADRSVVLLEGATGRLMREFPNDVRDLRAVARGKEILLVGSERATVYQIGTWKILRSWALPTSDERATYWDITPDGKTFASALEGRQFLVHGPTLETSFGGQLHNFWSTNFIQVSPDGRALVADWANYDHVRGFVQVGKRAPESLPERLSGAFVHPKRLALYGERQLRLVDPQTLRVLVGPVRLMENPFRVRASLNGETIALHSSNLQLLKGGDLKSYGVVPTKSFALCEDGCSVVTASKGTVTYWHLASGKKISWSPGGSDIELVGLSTSGKVFLASSGHLRVWSLAKP